MSKDGARIEMDLAFGSAKPYGSSRSIVRRIAASLPLKPCPRVHFQLYRYSEDAGFLIGTGRQNGFVASLADIGWLGLDEEDDNDLIGGPRPGFPPGLVHRACPSHPQSKHLTRQRSLPSLEEGTQDPEGPTVANNEAIQKISALETELAKLRAQIAQIVLTQQMSAQPAAATGTPPLPPLSSGSLHPPPPPPPPPPPLPPASLPRTSSAMDLIKERREKNAGCPTVLDSKTAVVPSMLDVLKDMSKVKLRSVKSRPVEGDVKVKSSEPVDAVALITEALKRKFAHRHRRDSEREDEERFKVPVRDVKPQSETPLFGQHMLKQTGRKKLL